MRGSAISVPAREPPMSPAKAGRASASATIGRQCASGGMRVLSQDR
jgi:hypothetical protein